MKLADLHSSVSASSSPPNPPHYPFHPKPLPLSAPTLACGSSYPGVTWAAPTDVSGAHSARGALGNTTFTPEGDTQHSHRHLLNPSLSPAPLAHQQLPALPLSHSPHGVLSRDPISNFKLHFCLPLEPARLQAVHSTPSRCLRTPPAPLAEVPLLSAGQPRHQPPGSPGPTPETSGGRTRAGPRGRSPSSSAIVPAEAGGYSLGAPAPPGVSRLRVAEPRGSPQARSRAAAPPLPDPPTHPPSGVAANRVPPPRAALEPECWERRAGRSVWRERLGLSGQEGRRLRRGWLRPRLALRAPSAHTPGDKSRGSR